MVADDYVHDMSLTGKVLPDLRIADDGSAIRSKADWEKQRGCIAKRFLGVVGEFPTRREPLDVKWGESVEMPLYTRREVSFVSEPGDRLTAFALIPKKLKARVPGILCPHPTHMDGKEATAIPGVEKRDVYHYGFELAERGFVTIVPDHFCVPPRVPEGKQYDSREFEKKHPNWSPVGKQAWDMMRCVDFLETLPEVDASRIGCIGLSLGGNTTLWTSAFEPRVKAAVIACGTSSLRGDRNRRYCWVREKENYHYMPKLGQWLDRNEFPFEFHEIAALVAPRALMIQSGYHDEWCPGSAIMGEFTARVHDIYDLYGKPEAFAHIHHGEHHSFGPMWRRTAYDWLERWLV
jgi:hypothetical protein